MILPSVRRRKDRDNLWYAYFRLNGKQKQVVIPDSLKFTKKAAEEAAIGVAEAYVARNPSTPGETPLPPQKGSDRLIRDEFKRWMRLKYAFSKPNTIEAVKNEGEVFFSQLSVGTVAGLNKDEASNAVEAIFKAGIAPRYWRNVLGTLKRFFKWMVKEGLMKVNPVEDFDLPKSETFKKVDETWTDDEVKETVKRLSPIDGNRLMVLRYTGMYPGDLYEFAKKHIVKDKEEGYKIVKRRAKAKYPSEVINQPLLPQVEEIIMAAFRAAKEPDDLLFVQTKSSLRVWRIMFKDRVGTAYRKAYPGKPEKQLKSLRHSFATWLMENDIPIDVAKKWMGHSPNSTLLESVYTHRQSAVKYAKRLA